MLGLSRRGYAALLSVTVCCEEKSVTISSVFVLCFSLKYAASGISVVSAKMMAKIITARFIQSP